MNRNSGQCYVIQDVDDNISILGLPFMKYYTEVDYNEVMHRYCQCIAVRWGGRATSIQGIEGRSLLLLLVLAVKKREVSIGCFLLEKMRKEDIRNGTKE